MNYKDRQYDLIKDKPWKNSNLYKGLRKIASRHISLLDSEELHHYDYNKINCFFVVDKSDHRRIHTMIELNNDSLCFIDKGSGEHINTLSKHMQILDCNGIDYNFVVL